MRKILLFLFAIPAFGAYNYVRPVVIPHKNVSADLTNFPMLVSGTFPYLAGNTHGGSVTSASGYDIIFASDSGCTTKLNFERATYSSTTGQAQFYVKVPTVSHTTDTTIYLCYGNSSVTTEQASSPWDANYVTVNHLEATPPTVDSTGTLTFSTSGSPTAGNRGQIVNAALLHNASSDFISATTSAFNASSDRTFEAWINPATLLAHAPGDTGVLDYGKSGAIGCVMFLTDDGSGINREPKFGCLDTSSGLDFAIAATALRVGKWYHLVGTFSSGNVSLYVNGMQFTSTTPGTAAAGDSTYGIHIGNNSCCTSTSGYFDGAVDEVRVSNVARSAAWIKAEYANELDPGSFYSIALPASNSGTFTNVSVVGTTNTQAIIRFTYSGTSLSACTVAASKNPSLYPVTNDLDATKFTNANLVTRDSANTITGKTAQIVIGKRYKAYTAADGNRYSRALNQNSTYYFSLNCDGNEYDGSFSTRPLAMGDTHLDGIPYDTTSANGSPAWPSPIGFDRCNTSDAACPSSRRDSEYIDPQTGVLIKHLIMPADATKIDNNVQAPLVTGTGWTIPGGWNTSTTATATISASTSPMVLGQWQDNGGVGYSHAFHWGDVVDQLSKYAAPVMMQFSIKANVGNAGCTAGNTNPDCAMRVCVTLNWQTCAPNAQTYTQYLTTSATQYTFGSGQPYDTMQQAGKRIWTQSETSWRGGGVTCDGSTTVTKIWDSSTMPPDQNPAGSYIWIKPIGTHLITGNIDALHFTVDTACPSSSGALASNNDGPANGEWFVGGSAFGVMVWKQTNSADTLTVANAYINTLAEIDFDPQYNSGFYGSPSPVTLGNGDAAGLLQMHTGTYSLDLTNGKVGAAFPAAPNSGLNSAAQSSSFDASGNYWVMGNDKSLTKYVYQGDWSTAITQTGASVPQWEWDLGSLLPSCTTTLTSQCFQSPTTITQAGQTLDVLLTAFDSRYSTNPFGDWHFHDVELGKLIFDIHWSGAPFQNYWGWIMIFDPQATSNIYGPYGAGCVGQNTNPAGANYLTPGCIIAAKRGWESQGARWATEKELGQMLQDGWMAEEETIYAFGSSAGGGPAVANKVSTATTGSCPTNPYSLTSCITFTVDGDPYDFLDGPGRRGVLGTYAVGDYAQLGVDDVTYPGGPIIYNNNIPMLQLVKINGTQLTFGCLYGASYCLPNNSGTPIDINPQMLWMYSNWPGMNYPYSSGGMVDIIAWDYADDPHGANASGNTVVWDYSTYNAHSANGNGLISSGGTNSPRCTANQGCYNNQNFQGLSNAAFAAAMLTPGRDNVTGLTAMSSYFAGRQGFNGACGNDNCQTHPDVSKLGSDPVSLTMVDGRPFVGIGSIPATRDISLVTGTLYKVANISGTLHPKIFDTMGTTARRLLRNISGPGSVIASDSSGYYTMCQALLANECRSGSAPGDFYVNIPYLDTFIPGSVAGSACYYPPSGFAGGTSDNWSINDLCVYDAGMETQSGTRYQLSTFDMLGASEQAFGHLFSNGRSSIYTAVHPATNLTSSTYKQWYYFSAQFWDGVFTTMLMESPPISNDTVRRTTFQPLLVKVTLPAGADHYGVEFGYAEYGADGQGGFECSPNRSNDPCVATGSTVNESTPFYWESETPTGATTGQIAVPALPEHVLYYRPVFYSGTTVVGRGAIQTAVIQ